MRKFRQVFDEKNILFQLQLYVQIVGNKEDLVLEMRESFIKENVMQLEKI
jgi:hypothetical protein